MKNIFKSKLLILISTILLFQMQNSFAWDWPNLQNISLQNIKDVTNSAKNTVYNAKNSFLNFFNSDTNPFIQKKLEAIDSVETTFKNLKNEISKTTKIQNRIQSLVNTSKKQAEGLVDLSKQTSQLEKVNTCLSTHKKNLNGLLGFIDDNKKTNYKIENIPEECTNKTIFTKLNDDIYKKRTFLQWMMGKEPEIEKARTFVGQNEAVCTPSHQKLTSTTNYSMHDSLATEGIETSNLSYGEEFVNKQKKIFDQTNQCLTQAKSIGEKEIAKLLDFKEKAYDQHIKFKAEKAKFLVKELLKSITPDNQYLKWAVITALTVGSLETAYALTYGVVNKDLRKGILNTMKFNWNILKFFPYTLPKWSFNKLSAITKWTLNKMLNAPIQQNRQNFNRGQGFFFNFFN